MEFSTNPSAAAAPDFTFKVLVVGDITTGKTSFCRRFARGEFSTNSKPTIGVDMLWKTIELPDRRTARVNLWDIAGQERFGTMTRVYYKEAHAAVVLFDVTQVKTFQGALRWKKDIDEKCPDIPCVLVANKIDLVAADQLPQLQEFVAQNKFISSVYTSVKDNKGIDDAITAILHKMPSTPLSKSQRIQLSSQDPAKDEETCIPKCMK